MKAFVISLMISNMISPCSIVQKLENGESEYSVHIFVDYLLKLGIASTYLWLLIFYGFFHVFLNVLAEGKCLYTSSRSETLYFIVLQIDAQQIICEPTVLKFGDRV